MLSSNTAARSGERAPLSSAAPYASAFPTQMHHDGDQGVHLASISHAAEPTHAIAQQQQPIVMNDAAGTGRRLSSSLADAGSEARFQQQMRAPHPKEMDAQSHYAPHKELRLQPQQTRPRANTEEDEGAYHDDSVTPRKRKTAEQQEDAPKPKDTSPQFVPSTALERAQWWVLYPPQLSTHHAHVEDQKLDCGFFSLGGTNTKPQTVHEFQVARVAFGRRLFGEFIGTTMLIFAIVGLKIRANLKFIDALGATFGSGLALSALIFCLGGTCGAHFNPVVSLAFFLRRSFPGRWVLPYWSAQFLGALLAGGLIRSIFPHDEARLGNTYPENGFTTYNTLWIETLMTFFFVFVILVLSKKGGVSGANAALGIGFTLSWILLFMVGIDGGGLNPWRSLCPAIFSGPLNVVWPYLIGPVLGMLLAVAAMWIQFGALTSLELQTAQGNGGK